MRTISISEAVSAMADDLVGAFKSQLRAALRSAFIVPSISDLEARAQARDLDQRSSHSFSA